MTLLKWSMILLYWVWLCIRNVHAKERDWRLFIQILINLTVILLIIMEDREQFIAMIEAMSPIATMVKELIRSRI